ncbi:flippase-like domain-containing protein, partial [SAR202 cluster bacterium AD-804-J14_MRT_500m]|nr:flippase-like domain-containing protein [SAR202 cluster bacterium AD-804-J14_MRT_500m]
MRFLIKNWRFWLGFIVSAGFIGLFLATVDLNKMGHALANARYQYVAVAVALYFSAVFFRTLRWKYLLEPMGLVGVARLFPVVTVGYMANNILPARLGEVVRAYYLTRREGIPASAGLATIIVERVYDGLTLIFLAAVSAPVIILAGLVDGSKTSVQVSWGIFGLVSLFIFLFAIGALTLLA